MNWIRKVALVPTLTGAVSTTIRNGAVGTGVGVGTGVIFAVGTGVTGIGVTGLGVTGFAVGVGAGVGAGVGSGVGVGVGIGEDVGIGIGASVGGDVGIGVGAGVGLAVGLADRDGVLDATAAMTWLEVGDEPDAGGGRTEVASQTTAMIMARKP